MSNTYTIRYNHTSNQTSTNYKTAMDMVRTQAIRTQGTCKVRLHTVDAGETYVYLSKEDLRNDDSGARAFAVIEKQ